MKKKQGVFLGFAVMIIMAIFTLFITSCNEKGGTFAVKNDCNETAEVHIYDAKNKLVADTTQISIGETKNFEVSEDGSYSIQWKVLSYINLYEKKVSISGGETVTVSITNEP